MFLLVLFAFLAGIITVLSPCILPVLPIVLSGSFQAGKHRPLGVVIGFVASFTVFTLFLSSLVRLLPISSEFFRNLAIVVLIVMGAAQLLPAFQARLEQLWSKVANLLPSTANSNGFSGGLILGLSLGLLWTPCVGPILASVIALALTGTVTSTATFIVFAYSLGTAIPLFFLVSGGQTLLQKLPRLARYAGRLQQIFGSIMILTALALFFQLDRQFQTFILSAFPQYGAGLTKIEQTAAVTEQLKALRPDSNDQKKLAPELVPGGEWFNSQPLQLSELRGKVVLIDFWTYTCINCIRTLPYVEKWYEKYKDQGLVVIGVHTPEFEFEKNASNVGKAIKDFGLTYPIVQDNNYATWMAFDNHYWPAKFFIDKDGKIRSSHFGEGEYDQSEKMIQDLLRETGMTVSEKIENPETSIKTRTPETYLGYNRAEFWSSPEQVRANVVAQYSYPNVLNENTFALQGNWNVGGEYAAAQSAAALEESFDAQNVYLVMRPTDGKSSSAQVLLDGKVVDTNSAGKDVVNGAITISADRLYHLIHLANPGRHTLEIRFTDGNVEVFAFTFG